MEAIEPGAQRTGAMLSTARIAAGLDIVEVASKTRVPVRHLKAIDADDHSNLPALPYAIGFVKAYAKAVGLDPAVVADQFRAETSKTAHVPTAPSLEPLDERRVPARGLVMASVAVVVLIIAGLSAWGAGMFDSTPAATPAGIAAAPEMSADVIEPPPGDVGVAVPAETAIAPAAGATGGQVVLTANEDVWIKIYDRGTRTSAKIGILKAGESFAVPAEPPGLLLWTGKAGALTITVGGRAIPSLGGPVEAIRDVSLAASDLLARTASPAAAPPVGKPPAVLPPAVTPVAVPPALPATTGL